MINLKGQWLHSKASQDSLALLSHPKAKRANREGRATIRTKSARLLFSMMALVLFAATTTYADDDKRMVKGIEDNSFLIEEAYNQERGVVQHIATLHRQQRNWFLGFTQEWPLGSQDHQFSYTVPYSWLRDEDKRVQGFGDIELNYRWQALYEKDRQPAFAPRWTPPAVMMWFGMPMASSASVMPQIRTNISIGG